MIYLQKIYLITVFVVLCFSVSVVKADDLADKIDKLFAKWDSTESPGAAVAVHKDGKIVYKRGFGMANLDHDIPITPKTVFRIASTSKQFTAFCIALLVEQGKISLDDDIRKYVPEMPDYGNPISVRHLIHHSSGIRDFAFLMALAEMPFGSFMTDSEMLAMISRQRELNFKPGEEYAYSNSGYFLLSLIVQRASGSTLREFAEEHIFKPLGMKNTHFHDDHAMVVKNRATGYSPGSNGKYKIDVSMGDCIGDDGIFTTVEDLSLWINNFYQNKLGKGGQELIRLVLTPGELNNGQELSYAFGLTRFKVGEIEIYSHTGGWVGYQAQMLFFTKQNFGVSVLSNLSSGINPALLASAIAELYYPQEFKKAMRDKTASGAAMQAELTEDLLKAKVGEYYDPNSDTFIVISQDKNTLNINGIDANSPLIPVSESHFKASQASLEVVFLDRDGKSANRIRLIQQGKKTLILESIKKIDLNESQLKEYTGKYHNDEVQKTFDVIIENSLLRMKHRLYPLYFTPVVKDRFLGMGGAVFASFQRNSKGEITGFSLKTDRISHITFKRQ